MAVLPNSPKQDRSGVRTASDLERKYNLGDISVIKKAVENSAEGINKTNKILEDFMVATVGTLENLQTQIDGSITTWFYEGVPSLDNKPASEWKTDELRKAHSGDLYYDKDTGYAYRFASNEDGTYEWLKIVDNDVVEALALANAASDTADSKRRVFTEVPYPPYDCGDLWLKNKEIYVCQISKSSIEVYSDKDFIVATKYTDDTLATQIGEELVVVRGTVTTIQESFDSFKVDITTTVKGLDEDLEVAKTSIEANTSEISLKVDKNGVIGAINLSEEDALIQAERINLVGAVTITSLDSSVLSSIEGANTTAQSALSTANEAKVTAQNVQPLIGGTQTKVTGAWTGKAPFSSLVDGQKISYALPYNGSGNASLNLTLSDGTTTGALPVYYNANSRVTTQYWAGTVLDLTYRKNVKIGSGTYTGWWTTIDSNTYDRTRYSTAVKASAAITAGNIIVGNSSGYHHLKTGGTFDISYPILYAGSAIAGGSTGTNNYLVLPFTITTTQSLALTAYKAVYIKGKLAGSSFTPVSTAPLTQAVPTYDDGYYYMLLGTAYSTTALYLLAEHPIYRYKNGAFKSTAQIAAEIAAWAYNNDATYIDGGNIFSKSVTAAQINVEDLFAQDITATGTIRGVNLVGVKGQIGNWDITENGLYFENDMTAIEITPPLDNDGTFLACYTYDENLGGFVTDGYIAFDAKYRPYIYMYEYQGTLADIQQIDATTVTATYVQTKAGADLDKINSNLNVYKSEMNDLHHLGTFYAKTTAQTFNINNISGYKTLVFIGMDDTGTLQLDSVFVPTKCFKMENIGVSINCYAWQNYRGIIAVRYVSDTSIVCLATEIMGWSEVGFRVYGMI